MKRTTVGRFWAYVGVGLALGISLAGNIAAAYLRDKDPSWVALGFSAIPPAVGFLAIEIVNHNPWDNESWGKAITRVMLFVVAPGAACVSFVHLTTVALSGQVKVPENLETILDWMTAILTALLIDGLIVGSTGALLLRAKAPVIIEPVIMTTPEPAKTPAAAQVPARAPQRAVGGKKRYAAQDHPLWADWLAAHQAGAPWDAAMVVKEMARVCGTTIEAPAARALVSRWRKAAEPSTST